MILTAIVALHETGLPPELVQAFRETNYEVFPPAAMVLNIGQANAALLDLYAQYGVTSAACITACNPFSAVLSDEENRARMESFRQVLEAAGRVCFAGEGRHPSNNWPGEPSLLILGVAREEAARLGCEQAQNAVVWCDRKGAPELLLLR